jgi:hypothetical protein
MSIKNQMRKEVRKMETGQMNMMQMQAGAALPVTASPSSSPAAMPGAGNQAGGVFAGLLSGMTPQGSSEVVAAVAGAGEGAVPVPVKTVGTVLTIQSDALAGQMAALLNAVGAVSTPLPTVSDEVAAQNAVPATGDVSGERPQKVVLNVAELQPALAVQVNNGRMPVTDDKGVVQAKSGASAKEDMPQNVVLDVAGLQTALVVQLNSGRMPVSDDKGLIPAAVGALHDEAPEPGDVSTGMPQAALTDAQQLAQNLIAAVGQNMVGSAVPVDVGHVVATDTAPQMNGSLAAEEIQKLAGSQAISLSMVGAAEKNQPQQTVQAGMELKSGMLAAMQPEPISPERGANNTVPAVDQKAFSGGSTLSAPERTSGGKELLDAGIRVSSGIEVRTQQQQVVTIPRSTSVEVALAEASPQSGASSGHTENAAAQAGQEPDMRPGKPDRMSASLPLPASDSQQAGPGTTVVDGRSSHTLDEARPVPANVVLDVGSGSTETRIENVQVRPTSGMVEKPMENVTADTTKVANITTSGKEFSNGDEKGAADQFMNGQFHPTLIHQQGKAENAGTVNNVSVPVQSDAPQSDLSSQIASQVRDRLVNHEAKPGNEQIVLRLSPENLGDLKLNLSLEGQKLKVEIVAENRMVRDALLQHTDSLKESLARQNISMESFDVTTNGRGAGNPGQGQQGDWRELARQKQNNAWMPADGYRLPDTSALSGQLAYQASSEHGMVDLHF